ncbi:MAG: hypothetical protein FWE67_12730 [Planctomycetaceae bacterium]|nr:hypothetical protein [Planctomycetaceae bacterium]
MKHIILFFVLSFFVSSVLAAEIRLSAQIKSLQFKSGGEHSVWYITAMVRSQTDIVGGQLDIKVPDGFKIKTLKPETADLKANQNSFFYFTVEADKPLPSASVEVTLKNKPELKNSVELCTGINLSGKNWKLLYAGEGTTLQNIGKIPDESAAWKQTAVPTMFQEIGITWLKTEVFVPEDWAAIPFFLTIQAIDDNDITYFNGKEIGRINGWDTLREYPVPKEMIRFGEVNEIVIAVHNTNAGGGIASDHIFLGVKHGAAKTSLFPPLEKQKESLRQPQRPIGKPLPLRPMVVRNGVLEYIDGGEVALWGNNYYPQSWNEWRFLKEGNADFHKVINTDLADLVPDKDGNAGGSPNRIDVIRIHVFDTEISDGEGNLIRNEHLDILDYLVSKCNENGIYLWLTPIAWWGSPSPNARADAFSATTPMQAMTLSPKALQIQQRYTKQFLEHINPYTKRRLVDEPCLVLFEIINEPLYWSWGELLDLSSRQHGRVWTNDKTKENTDEDPNVAYRKQIRQDWNAQLPGQDWEFADTWNAYQYQRVLHYIKAMCQTIRETGAKQPIAYSAWLRHVPAVDAAIADSPCETITFGIYPGGLTQTPQADKRNLLSATADNDLPELLKDKARLVYEFDASDTLNQIDLYPAIARYFRNMGVQVACQFQYDSLFNAAHNQAWATHYLNVQHTPQRWTSFLIGGETFRTLPRGHQWNPANPDEGIFPNTAVSYSKNAALFCTEDLFMSARPVDWKPLPLPKTPKRIISTGSTPYYDYSGSGIVDVKIQGDTAAVKLYPDVKRLKDNTLRGSVQEPLTKLETGKHIFKMKMPGWENVNAEVESGKTYQLKR